MSYIIKLITGEIVPPEWHAHRRRAMFTPDVGISPSKLGDYWTYHFFTPKAGCLPDIAAAFNEAFGAENWYDENPSHQLFRTWQAREQGFTRRQVYPEYEDGEPDVCEYCFAFRREADALLAKEYIGF